MSKLTLPITVTGLLRVDEVALMRDELRNILVVTEGPDEVPDEFEVIELDANGMIYGSEYADKDYDWILPTLDIDTKVTLEGAMIATPKGLVLLVTKVLLHAVPIATNEDVLLPGEVDDGE